MEEAPLDTTFRTCTLCEATCGIRVDVDAASGRVKRISGDPEDPFSKGHICPKAHGLIELHEDPDRLRQPMRRCADGSFEAISWDEALDLAGAGLARVRDAHGPDAVALYRGNPTSHDMQSLFYWNVMQRAIPSRNQYSAGSLDTFPRWVQARLMYGGFLRTPVPDIDRSDFLLMLGANPLASQGSLMTAPGIKKRLAALQARGGRFVVVDPRRTETAELADEHVFVRPGGDAALLLGMLHTLVTEDLVDVGEAAPYLAELPRLRELARGYSPERVSPSCGVAPETIRRLARELAAAPRAIVYGRMGTCVQRFGTLAMWGIDLLNIATGNLDREGGVLFPKPAAELAFAGGERGAAPPFGRYQSRVSGYDEIQGEFPMAAFAEEMEVEGDSEGHAQIRALAIIAGNPVSSAPNSDRTAAALEGLEFMVAFDYYINETTRHADLILPPTSPLEHGTYDVALLHFAVHNVAKWSPPALALEADAMPAWRAILGVAKRLLGLADLEDAAVDDIVLRQLAEGAIADSRFAAEIDIEAALEALGKEPGPERILDLLLRVGPYGDGFGASPGGLGLAKVRAAPHGLDLGALSPSLPEGLATPSGKVELLPERIEKDLARLELWIDEKRGSGEGDRFELIGRRDIRSMNSWLHNLPSLVKGKERCTLQVHPKDAERIGLQDRGRAAVLSRVGRIEVPVEFSDALAPGVVCLPHGWGHDLPGVQLSVARRRPGVNKNRIVDDKDLDLPSGTSVLNGIPVRVVPLPS